jgi:DNA (cytosine-5)-methyltransferase 1
MPRVELESQLKVIDLFSGAGGLSLGLLGSHNGVELDAVELNRDAAATFAENFPFANVHNSTVRDYIDGKLNGEADLVIGGPPCQGFSSLGNRDESDTRNQLWQDFMEVVFRTQAKAFVMENVPNFLKSKEASALFEMLAENGNYKFSSKVMNASDFGGAQGRKRAFIIGWLDWEKEFCWPEPSQGKANLRDVIFHLPKAQKSSAWDGTLGPRAGLEMHVSGRYSDIYLERFSFIPSGGNRQNLPNHLLLDCWKKPNAGFGDVMGRLRWDSPSVTIRTEFHRPEKGRYLHPDADRTITHLEAALIQGFPMDYRFVGTRTSVARQIGNAVPNALGRALSQQVHALLA